MFDVMGVRGWMYPHCVCELYLMVRIKCYFERDVGYGINDKHG